MDFIYIICRLLCNICIGCGNLRVQCDCHCHSTDHHHSFKCACGGRLNWHENRECPNCNDYVLRHGVEYELYQGQCLNCGQYAIGNDTLKLGWCKECRVPTCKECGGVNGHHDDCSHHPLNVLANDLPCDNCDYSPAYCTGRCGEEL
jgi:hypothetical protein